MEIIQSKNSDNRNGLIELYIEAFSTGLSQQYTDRTDLNSYIEAILEKGYALIAVENNELIGAILCTPLEFDKLYPDQLVQNFSIEKCVYVAEMMVRVKFWGQGIGKKLLTEFFKKIDQSRYSEAIIRVWDQNIPALNLYKKMGFEPIANIEQTKMKADGTGSFVMNKIYLHKKLN